MSTQQPLAVSSIVVATEAQVSSELGEEAVILGLEKNTYFGLDGVGALVWGMLSEPIRVADLRDAIVREYEVESEEAQRDLLTLLTDLAEHGLIETRDESAA